MAFGRDRGSGEGAAQMDSYRARISELEDERARLHGERRTRDTLDKRTGLPTLDGFREAASRELERARRSGAPMAVALFDVDGFRQINAVAGGEAGDAVLVELAASLRAVTRASDVLARTGADEVAVLCVDTPLDGVLACAQRMVERMAASPIPGAGHVTISAGAVEYSRGTTVEQLMAAAADGLVQARADGGGRLAVAADDPTHAEKGADIVDVLTAALTERDRYTGEHSESVVTMARAVAASFGLDELEVARIGQAALLHDIGKVAIPDHILNKPGPLDDDEWELMREHPVVGERILRAIPGMNALAHMVRHEHESFDGSGYPDGLVGDAIPLGSRIILACDTYHAITSDRPYRARASHEDAVMELARCAGSQFDPRVTQMLIGHLHALRAAGRLE